MTQPRLLGDRYELGPLIGYGGMAEVHRGRDVRLGREVAIKILRADLARDPMFQTRFGREAQSSAGLNHPSIVAVYDTGEDQTSAGPVPYIVMEFIEGRTLREVLNSEQRLPVARSMEVVAEVCAALDYSHRNGIVHRDIKPGNVMITRTGAVKVMDFGIARALADNGATVTQTAAVIGTAQYLSPEQARGETVDARSDVYSAGCLLYELLTGSPPFSGDSPVAVAYQHVRENAAPPSTREASVPRPLDAVVMKALAKNPLNRYQTAAEMRADLLRVIADQPVVAETVMSDDERTQFIGRSAAPAAVAAGAAAATEAAADEGSGRHAATYVEDDALADRDSSGLRIAAWIAGVLALILVIGTGGFLLLRHNGGNDEPTAPSQVAVPYVVGLAPADATNKLAAAGLKVDPEQPIVYSDTVEKGRVAAQSPERDELVDEGTAITLSISGGRQQIPVPSLVGLTLEQARAELQASGLPLSLKEINGAQNAGLVTGQNPPPTTMVDPGTTVEITVPNGKVALPDVRGMSYQDARAQLNQSDFLQVSENRVPNSDPARTGTVRSMNPGQASVVPVTTPVVLDVYDAPPTPTPTPTSSSPSPSGSTSGTGSASASP